MKKRIKIRALAKDRRMFTRTATKSKKINIVPTGRRGGICL